MEMVPYVANGEFTNSMIQSLLHQPIGEKLLEPLIREINDDHRTDQINVDHRKAIALFKLDTELSRRPISEGTLDLLILLGKIAGNQPSEALKLAFRETVVQCALRPPLKDKLLFERVKGVWDKVLLPEKKGLGSEALSSWKRDVQDAVWDDDLCKSLLEKFESVRAEEAVRVYVNEEKERIGPLFLNIVVEKVKTNPDFLSLMREFSEGMEKPVNTPPSASSSGKKRRIVRRWNPSEEEALVAGVAKFEEGRWKTILNDNPEAFDGRTEGDLKDKWRNMKKQRS